MLFFIVVVPIYIPTNTVGGFPFLHTLSSICYLWTYDGHSDWCEVVPHGSFDLHFSNNDVEHFFFFFGLFAISWAASRGIWRFPG